jgi:hypothetical protein
MVGAHNRLIQQLAQLIIAAGILLAWHHAILILLDIYIKTDVANNDGG